MIRITAHAIERFIERIDGSLSFEQARARIAAHLPACELARRFGAHVVLAERARLVIDGDAIVTVYPRENGWFSHQHLESANAGYRAKGIGA